MALFGPQSSPASAQSLNPLQQQGVGGFLGQGQAMFPQQFQLPSQQGLQAQPPAFNSVPNTNPAAPHQNSENRSTLLSP